MGEESKFDTCSYLDGPDMCYEKPNCCSPEIEKECYFCLHPELLIIDVTADICEKCVYYNKKEEINEQ